MIRWNMKNIWRGLLPKKNRFLDERLITEAHFLMFLDLKEGKKKEPEEITISNHYV